MDQPAECEEDELEEEKKRMVRLGSYGEPIRLLLLPPAVAVGDGSEDECPLDSSESAAAAAAAAAEETMLLWGLQQPTLSKPNAFVRHSSSLLRLDACGVPLSIVQSPSSMSTPGVTGAVMWDSGVVLGKFLEHAVDSELLSFQGKKVVELGSGCGLVGCIAALLGAHIILTDLPDRLRLLKKNVETNLEHRDLRGSAIVSELIWGDDPDPSLVDTLPDYVLGSDVVYSEGAVVDLLATLLQLSGPQTTIIVAGELRNDTVLEYFLEAAMENFMIGRVDQVQWHPDYRSPRVAIYIVMRKCA